MEILDIKNNLKIINKAANWFHSKWGVPTEAYLKCMNDYIEGKTDYGWFLCVENDEIIGGLGVIENDFHDRTDLSPNICALYVEEEHRGKGIAGLLLNLVVETLKRLNVSPVYLVTDHIGFYEKYGWEFYCEVQCSGESFLSRLYIHR